MIDRHFSSSGGDNDITSNFRFSQSFEVRNLEVQEIKVDMLFDQVNIENSELLSWKGFKLVGRGNNV